MRSENPRIPKESLAKIGKDIPYFVPAWEFSCMGISRIAFATSTFRMDCQQDRPRAMPEEASIQVETAMDIPIQSVAML